MQMLQGIHQLQYTHVYTGIHQYTQVAIHGYTPVYNGKLNPQQHTKKI